MSGRQKAPKDEPTLRRWAAALGLTPAEVDGFIEAALLEHTPMAIRERYVKMKDASEASAKGSKGPRQG